MPGVELIPGEGRACSSYICDPGIFSAEMKVGSGLDEVTASAQHCGTVFSLLRFTVTPSGDE